MKLLPMLSFTRTLALALSIVWTAAAARADATDDLFRSAANHYGQKQWQAACDDFAKLLDGAGDHPRANQARFHYGEALVQLGRYADARKQFDELLKRDSNDRYARQALFRSGEAAYLGGEHDAARRTLESFRQRYPDDELNAFVLAHLGQIELDDGKPAAAEPLFATAIERFKNGPLVEQCRLGLAEAREDLGRPGEARSAYEQLIDGGSSLADYALLHVAALDNAEGKPAAALERLDRLAKDFPASQLQDKGRLGRGYALYKLDRHAEAEKVLSELSGHPTLAVDADYWLGMAQMAQGEWAAAAKTFAAGANVDPQHRLNPALTYHAGKALFQDSKLTEAFEAFERVLERWPDSPWADDCLLGKLQVSAARGDQAGCVRLADEFEARYPDSALKSEVDAAKGRALAAMGKDSDAAVLLERSLAKNKSDGDTAANQNQAQLALATSYARLGRFADAGTIVKTQLEHKPPEVAAFETCYQVAEAAYAADDVETAAPLFALLASSGNPPDALRRGLLGQGWCHFKSKDWSTAAADFEKLLAQYPDCEAAPEAALLRGRALEHQEDLAGALAMYRVVIERHRQSPRMAEALYRAAGLCEKMQQPREAAALYAQLIREHADFAQLDAALYRSAWLARASGQQAEADLLFARLQHEFPDSQFGPDATLRLAERALAEGKHEDVQRLLTEIGDAKDRPAIRQPALYLQGRLAAATGRWPAVEEPLTKLLEEFPNGELAPAAAYLRAEASYRQGEYAAASRRLAELAARPARATNLSRHPRSCAARRPWLSSRSGTRRSRLLARSKKISPSFASNTKSIT